MRITKKALWAICLTAAALLGIQAIAQNVEPDELGFIIGQPEDLLPADGARSVLIYGNPSKPGLYVMRITFPPGAGSRPHYHSTARYITVIKGTWYTSVGSRVGCLRSGQHGSGQGRHFYLPATGRASLRHGQG